MKTSCHVVSMESQGSTVVYGLAQGPGADFDYGGGPPPSDISLVFFDRASGDSGTPGVEPSCMKVSAPSGSYDFGKTYFLDLSLPAPA